MLVSEAARGAQEAGGDEAELLCWSTGSWPRFALKALTDDVLDAADVDQVEAQSAPTGAIDSVASVRVHQAQQLLSLAQVRPREGAAEQLRHEAADVRAHLVRLADHPRGVTHRVRSEFLGIVVVVGASAARLQARVGLDQLAAAVCSHHLAVGTHPDLAADEAGRQGVQGFIELDVVVGVDPALLPRRRIEARSLQRAERGFLHRGEDHQWLLTGGAVDAFPSHL